MSKSASQWCVQRLATAALLVAMAVVIFAVPVVAQGQTNGAVISSGTLYSNSNGGPKWRSVDFDALSTGDHELAVTWDNAAVDLRISVFDDTTGRRIGEYDTTPGETVWTGGLDVARNYRVSIWVVSGGSTDYVARLSANNTQALAIASQPSDQTVFAGEDAVFTVSAIGGSGTLRYQWSVDGVAIAGATANTLTLTSVTVGDSGSEYAVAVSDDTGIVLPSAAATLNVLPASVAVIGEGILDSARGSGPRWVRIDFDSLATATHTVTVSWNSQADVRFRVRSANGAPVSPVISSSSPSAWQGELTAGESYYIGVWSNNGVANYTATIEAAVETAVGPSITTQPSDQTVAQGGDATFSVAAAGAESLTFQWYVDGVAIAGATESELTVENVIQAESGAVYSVEVSNGNATTVSADAILTVETAPSLELTSHPADITVNSGSDAVFTVATSGGSGQLNYQWYADDAPISGATTDSLTLVAVSVVDSGTDYSVVVSDANSTLVSDAARLTVVALPASNNFIAQWQMNEAAGASVMIDSSGNGHHGTIGGDVVTAFADTDATSYRWLFSLPTETYQPERIINAPHHPDLNPGTGDYSITMRYRTNVPFGNIIQKGQGGSAGGYWKIENPAGHLTCVFRGVASNGGWNRKEVVSSVPLNDGEYHTITCERIGTTLRLIVDGVLDDTANNSTGSISNNRPISIGGKTNCDNVRISCDYFSGWIDEITIGPPQL